MRNTSDESKLRGILQKPDHCSSRLSQSWKRKMEKQSQTSRDLEAWQLNATWGSHFGPDVGEGHECKNW